MYVVHTDYIPNAASDFQRAVLAEVERHGGWGSVIELPPNPNMVELTLPRQLFGSDAGITFLRKDDGVYTVVWGVHIGTFDDVETAVAEALRKVREYRFPRVVENLRWYVDPSE